MALLGLGATLKASGQFVLATALVATSLAGPVQSVRAQSNSAGCVRERSPVIGMMVTRCPATPTAPAVQVEGAPDPEVRTVRDDAAQAPAQAPSRPREFGGAETPSQPSDLEIFLPGHREELERYLVARTAAVNAERDRCIYRMENRYPQTSRILPAEEQIRQSNETTAMLAACNRAASIDLRALMDALRGAVTRWAAAQPADYDGLRALKSGEHDYRQIGFYASPGTATAEIGRRVKPVIAKVFAQRRAEIESQIRPTLVTEVVRANDVGLISDLFDDDEEIVSSYRGMLNARRTQAAQDAAEKAVAPGLNGQLAVAATQAFARAPRIVFGQAAGMTTVAGAKVEVNAVVQTERYEFAARNARCTPAPGGKRSCSYDLNLIINGSALGFRLPEQQSGWVHRQDVFYLDGSTLRSDALDRHLIAVASASQGRSVDRSDNKCEIRGGPSLTWQGGGGMPSGVEWDNSIRTPC